MANSDERAGQPESMEQVIALYYDQIYKFCYWKTHSAVDAQDITQDTFVRFMDAAQTYSDIESPKALLYTIAHHLCLNWLKKVPPDSLDELRWDQEPAAEDFADHAVQTFGMQLMQLVYSGLSSFRGCQVHADIAVLQIDIDDFVSFLK